MGTGRTVTPKGNNKILQLPKLDSTKLPPQQSSPSPNPFKMPTDAQVFAMRDSAPEKKSREEVCDAPNCHPWIQWDSFFLGLNDLQTKRQPTKGRLYDAPALKKNFKALLQDDPEDLAFYEKLRKREAEKISTNRRERGTVSFYYRF